MSKCFGCEKQTVYSRLNRTEITENRHQKLKPNRTKKNLNRGSPNCTKISGRQFIYYTFLYLQDIED